MNASMGAGAPEVIDVLVPTCNRPAALAVTLAMLGAQSWPALRIVIADQSDGADARACAEVQAVLRYLRATGRRVETHRRPVLRGMAEQRAFLLAQAGARYCLFVDDDVLLEPDLMARLHAVIRSEGCGFVGSALHGLSYLGERRPLQETIEFWEGPVMPEAVHPGTSAWTRHHLHSAANLFHVQSNLCGTGADGRPDKQETRRYKVAWVGGCVMFDRAMLHAAGGFDFWPALPSQHCGEDVLAQQRVMARFGGCAILPSGAYHMELPTTVTARAIDAPYVLPLGSQAEAQPASQPASQLKSQPESQSDFQSDFQSDSKQAAHPAPQPVHVTAPPSGVTP
ncbi:glycosyltransferase family A protein [Massilia sp. 9096]|uniref:glycosyltransferase family 2 protein n=1 Tax=Massilia sp. 9096 TaxID=1500894 RepID=UPI001EFADC11|nr:glycosyltransferase family A protein [Massilia sp. 9096]